MNTPDDIRRAQEMESLRASGPVNRSCLYPPKAEYKPSPEAVELRMALIQLLQPLYGWTTRTRIEMPVDVLTAIDTAERILHFNAEYYARLIVTVQLNGQTDPDSPFPITETTPLRAFPSILNKMRADLDSVMARLEAIDDVSKH